MQTGETLLSTVVWLGCFVMLMVGTHNRLTAELWCLSWAMQSILDLHLDNVTFALDCKSAIAAISNPMNGRDIDPCYNILRSSDGALVNALLNWKLSRLTRWPRKSRRVLLEMTGFNHIWRSEAHRGYMISLIEKLHDHVVCSLVLRVMMGFLWVGNNIPVILVRISLPFYAIKHYQTLKTKSLHCNIIFSK